MTQRFTGIWIPSEVLAMPLTVTAKLTYGMLAGLDNEDGCFASNGYIASVLGCSDRQVRNIVSELEDAKLIIRGITGGVRIIRTVEKDALCKVLGAETDFHPRRKRTSAGGGNTLPPYSIDNNKEDKGMVELPFKSVEFIEAWNRYTNHRRQIKRPISKAQIHALFEQFKGWGESRSINNLHASILNGWVGVFADKTYNPKMAKTLDSNDHKSF